MGERRRSRIRRTLKISAGYGVAVKNSPTSLTSATLTPARSWVSSESLKSGRGSRESLKPGGGGQSGAESGVIFGLYHLWTGKREIKSMAKVSIRMDNWV